MVKSILLFIPAALLLFVISAEARDTIQTFSIREALESGEVRGAINNRIKLYWGSQGYQGVVKNRYGNTEASQRTAIMEKTKKRVCEWAFAGAIKTLQEAAIRDGGNAVINISSNVNTHSYSSTSNFDCAVGAMFVKVILSGDVVRLGPATAQPAADKYNGGYTIREIVGIQKRLDILGYAPGAADGFVGPATRAALKMFQADNNLIVTGGLDIATVDKLYGRDKVIPEETVKAEEKMAAPAEESSTQEIQENQESFTTNDEIATETPGMDEITLKLEKYSKLRQDGVISEEEFDLLKERALSEHLRN